MILGEMRAIAKVSQDGWIVSWTSQGYIISKGIDKTMQLEAERAGKRKLRLIQSLDAVARIMAEDLGVHQYSVRGRVPGQQEIF